MPDLPVHPLELDEVLLLALREGAPLWELPLGSDCGMHGGMVVHPPPDLTQASTRLLGWLDAGLIELVEDATPADWLARSGEERYRLSAAWHPAVPVARAREVLADPTRWTPDSPDGRLALSRTDQAAPDSPPA